MTTSPSEHASFPIVRIGTSSGGLEAFSRIVTQLPPDSGMAFVLLQHLDPAPESRLAELLAKLTVMPVIEAVDGMRVRPNRIYVVPPRSGMTLVKGRLSLQPRDATRAPVRTPHEPDATIEYLHSTIERQDEANELLRSANEEILSSNEALQATNAELEIAQEELHRRNLELDLVNDDLTNLLSSTSIPVVMVGGDLRIRRITGPAFRVLNLLPSDVGRTLSDPVFGSIVPDLPRLVQEVIRRRTPLEREVMDREGRWCLMRVHPYYTADDHIEGAVIIMLDFDDMRQAQAELREKSVLVQQQAALLELSQDAVVVRDADNRVQSWNRGAQEMYGYDATEALGQPLERLLLTDASQWQALNDELDRAGEWEGELRQFRRDGTPILVHSREVLVRDAEGRRSAVLSIKRDITELRRAMEALTEADRRKDEFLATLAHELRNPLAPVRNAIEIMRIAGNNPETMAQVRSMLDRQVQQLSRIVDDLIDVSRIVEKKIELRRERIALTHVVDLALETCRSRIAGRQQQLSVALPAEPILLDADPVRLSQILINLLDNASKYTEAGGHIWLSAEQRRNGGELVAEPTVIIRVRDDGIGIAPEVLPTVFDMFTQGARTRAQGRGGLGVGLTLVRSLVEMHQGDIHAESEGVGRGTEFTVRLPAASHDESADARLKAARAEMRAPERVRLVVVDDSADHAESLGMLLQLMGHEVFLASSGPEALEAIARHQPDVALIDIGLPGMNGYEVAMRIREQPKFRNMVLVAQTGWGQTEDRVRSRNAGFDHHLVKPVSREALETILKSLRR